MKRVWSAGAPPANLPKEPPIWRKPEGHVYSCRVFVFPESEVKYTVQCPMLPGMTSTGSTEAEALKNITEALATALKAYNERGEKIPWVKVQGDAPKGAHDKSVRVQI